MFAIIINSTKIPKGGRGHVTVILRYPVYLAKLKSDSAWFVTNYSNNCRLDCSMGIEGLYYYNI